jgi:hypothetical protein
MGTCNTGRRNGGPHSGYPKVHTEDSGCIGWRPTFERATKLRIELDKVLLRNRDLKHSLDASERTRTEQAQKIVTLTNEMRQRIDAATEWSKRLELAVRQRDDLRGEKVEALAECDAWRDGLMNLTRQLLEQGVKFSVIVPERLMAPGDDKMRNMSARYATGAWTIKKGENES